jgi:hypothetical protein
MRITAWACTRNRDPVVAAVPGRLLLRERQTLRDETHPVTARVTSLSRAEIFL